MLARFFSFFQRRLSRLCRLRMLLDASFVVGPCPGLHEFATADCFQNMATMEFWENLSLKKEFYRVKPYWGWYIQTAKWTLPPGPAFGCRVTSPESMSDRLAFSQGETMAQHFCTTFGKPMDGNGEVCDNCIDRYRSPDDAPQVYCNSCGKKMPADSGGFCECEEEDVEE
jgi:hypothetical protein